LFVMSQHDTLQQQASQTTVFWLHQAHVVNAQVK